MIVYLQRNFADEENESHGLRNTLAVGGALVGGHFAAKGGLLGRHAQRWAGNNHARLGNLFGSTSMFRSGQNAAAEASAKIAYGRLGWLGASKQEQARAIVRARNGETSWTKNLGDGKTKKYEFKDVVQANDNMVNKLAQEKQQKTLDRLQTKAKNNNLTGDLSSLNGKSGEEFKKGYEEVKNNRTAAKPETPATKPETPATKPETPTTDTAAQPQSQQGSGATGQEVVNTSKSLTQEQNQHVDDINKIGQNISKTGQTATQGSLFDQKTMDNALDPKIKAQQQAANAWQEEGRTLSYRGLRNIRLRRL